MAGVSIVGSGNFGASTAFFVAKTCTVAVTLVDSNVVTATAPPSDPICIGRPTPYAVA